MRFTATILWAMTFRGMTTGAMALSLSLLGLLIVHPGTAQLIPDNTLGTERSQPTDATINGLPAIQIEGGARRTRHLFHSFQDFNVSAGQQVYFANPVGVQTILTRVTGRNPSAILGTLGVQGLADLFLVNPRGILFGPDARLDLRGSFIASTADGVQFNDGFDFAATNPQAPPLLSVNIPVGLRFRDRPGAIVNQSVAQQAVLGFPAMGLVVDPGQSIALLGGDLRFDNGTITALQGTVHLGSVASAGTVGLTSTPAGLTVNYRNSRNFGAIALSGTASVNAIGAGGGAIRVRGGQVTLRDRANLASDTIGDVDGRGIMIEATQFRLHDRAFVGAATIGAGDGGDLTIRATEGIELQGISFENFQQTLIEPVLSGTVPDLLNREGVISTGTLGTGRAGNITIATRRLTLQRGAVILSPTLSSGAGGNLAIRATEEIDVSGSGILTTAVVQGNAGTLTLNTHQLTIRDESLVTTATFGSGNGGNLTVNATDVRLSEFREVTQFGNSLSTSTVGGTGNAGTLTVNTRSLLVEGGATITSASGAAAIDRLISSNGRGGDLIINAADSITIRGTSRGRQPSRSQIVTAALGSGASGELRLTTRRLVIQNGGAIGGSTVSSGQGGDIIINASESVEITGIERSRLFSTGVATASGDPLIAGRFPINPTGAAGNINLTTGRLSLQAGATINAESVGIGDAGTINLVADVITLDNESSIVGNTGSGTGGNINLRSQVLQLQDESRISSDAGQSAGGNIGINSQFLVAFPTQNSDITANARTDRGGRVTVNAPYIFGIAQLTQDELRSRLALSEAEFAALRVNPANLLSSNDITAISQTAPRLQGTVVFGSAGINPAQSLVELPQTVVDPNTLIAANPCTQTRGSEFIVTGRGGLPFNPNDVLSGQAVSYPWIEPNGGSAPLTRSGVGEWGSGGVEEWRSGLAAIANAEERVAEVQPAQGWRITEDEVILVAQNSELDHSNLANSDPDHPTIVRGERSPQVLSVCLPR